MHILYNRPITLFFHSLQKRVSYRPKYTELKRSQFFVRHNVEPLNVFSWLQTLNLAHLRQSITSSALLDVVAGSAFLDPLEVNTGATPDQDRPSATTPTPESAQVYTNGSCGGNRLDFNQTVQTRGNSRSDTFSTVPVSAPDVHTSHHSDYADLTNGVSRLTVGVLSDQFTTECPHGSYPLPRPPATTTSKTSPVGTESVVVNESFYSIPSEGRKFSPQNSMEHPSKTLSDQASSATLSTSSSPKCPADVRSGSVTNVSDYNISPFGCPCSLPRRNAEQSFYSDQRISSSLALSQTTRHDDLQIPMILPKVIRRANANGTRKLPQSVDTEPVEDTCSKSKHVYDTSYTRSPESQSMWQSTPQSRSASVGAQLRRSHARRWQSKPSFPPYREPLQNHELPLPNPALSRFHGPAVKSSNSAGHHAPQNYHHHYYYYFYQQAGLFPNFKPGQQRAMTPPLVSDTSRNRLNENLEVVPPPKYPNPVCRNGLNPVLSGRLTHRLYTHPLPRQNDFLSRLPHFDPHVHSRTAAQPVNLPLPVAENRLLCPVQNRPVRSMNSPDPVCSHNSVRNNLSRSPSRGPHRSSSQPAGSHDWLSFETEL